MLKLMIRMSISMMLLQYRLNVLRVIVFIFSFKILSYFIIPKNLWFETQLLDFHRAKKIRIKLCQFLYSFFLACGGMFVSLVSDCHLQQ